MKNRPSERGDAGEKSFVANRNNKFNSKRKNRQRLGGNGLSLQAFANAKSTNSYNPHLIKKQREMYKNAKLIKKFKKTLKQENYLENPLPRTSILEVEDTDGDPTLKNVALARRKKKKNTLQSAREEYEKKHEEDEKVRREREAIIQAKKEERAKAEARRKDSRERMFKKTRSGQPVMKYRIEHLLEGIAAEDSNR